MSDQHVGGEHADLLNKSRAYLEELCVTIPNRRVGSRGNRRATEFFAATVASFGFETECPEFDCLDWSQDGAQFTAGGQSFEALVSPYSLGGQADAPLLVVSTVEELAAVEAANPVLMLRGDLAQEQLMPKNFPFYNPEHHRQIIHLLETKQPQAIVAATSRNPELAGGLYPFPLIEDGDFDIPSVYMTEEEGDRLARYAGQRVSLNIKAKRIPATGCNVIARKGIGADYRVVVCAHIDAKLGTPGAIDNGTGVVILLLLAELLAGYTGRPGLEILAVNGEDYYGASGEIQYVNRNAGQFGNIRLAVNIDAAGYHQGKTAYSLYNCPAEVARLAHKVFAAQPDMMEGEPWYQSDHTLFIQNQVPAIAITSEHFMELSTHVTHTPKDTPEIIDHAKLVNIAQALHNLVLGLQEKRL